ncbi:hypothetical protein [Pannonibacter sp.]|uniref:hypothetical protein n=1 Tax=Pannonibacter sp. TaxID=1906786 RepID=UPI003F7104D5
MEVFQGVLCVAEDDAKQIMDFLTFRLQTDKKSKSTGHRGLWSAPLVQIPGTDEFALVVASLETSNTLRKVESWLEKGGVNDRNAKSSRGERYEIELRSEISSAIESNILLKDAKCASEEIKSKDFGEQIDLLFCIGDLCVVGEIKFFLMPAEPHERFRYDKKLESAADQARRKVDALERNRNRISKYLNISFDRVQKLRIIPIVITAQGYGFSLRVKDVLIVDAKFLLSYLGNGRILTNLALGLKNGKIATYGTSLYDSEVSAAEKFEVSIAKPYVLNRFLERINFISTPFPCLSHHGAMLKIPNLTDVQDEERDRAIILRNKIE